MGKDSVSLIAGSISLTLALALGACALATPPSDSGGAPGSPSASPLMATDGGFVIFGEHTPLPSEATALAEGTKAPGVTPTPSSIFSDVPWNHWAKDYVEAIFQQGYTGGCADDPPRYCPDAAMNRAENAVFVERALHSPGYAPPLPANQIFEDVLPEAWYAPWVHALFEEGFTSGCSQDPLRYCPSEPQTRAESAVLYLRVVYGADYEPPLPAVQLFTDVPLDAWYAAWVQAAYNAGLFPPCEHGKSMRFCPGSALSRAIAAFVVVKAKGLAEVRQDLTAPAAITDLAIVEANPDNVVLRWSAPGDDDLTGSAFGYDIRFSSQPVTEATWSSAIELLGEPPPKPAGSIEVVRVEGLDEGVSIYLALRSVDEVGNLSALSNVAIRMP